MRIGRYRKTIFPLRIWKNSGEISLSKPLGWTRTILWKNSIFMSRSNPAYWLWSRCWKKRIVGTGL